jgi:hypothetical protein
VLVTALLYHHNSKGRGERIKKEREGRETEELDAEPLGFAEKKC